MIDITTREKIISEYLEKKKSFMQLARDFGFSRMTIAAIVKEAGIKTQYFVELPEKEIVRQYVEDRISAEELAKRYGVSNSPINKILHRNGIEKRDRSECHMGQVAWNRGKKWSDEMKKKLSRLAIGKRQGKMNGNWRGGRPNLPDRRRNWRLVKEWRRLCLERDCRCRQCGSDKRLEVHHIKPLRSAEDVELLADVSNGITLCRKCHQKTQWHEHEYEDFFRNLLKKPLEFREHLPTTEDRRADNPDPSRPGTGGRGND